ncbi:Piso0_004831 [Millerozyma farinosa CBS 7064]|uniref:Piso0_004831 protein n=1 Tax=Pichia sorbitophila (strain ATCC MYA-4447 / BCRC 22081 / CBS 7064 / NBRC 10061 / NRRL Y-12695) TaxID=559304 RepID=G8Y3I1_PICSO|nr:Piso0_004831 [Millerozyma farinosa CBS 7064]
MISDGASGEGSGLLNGLPIHLPNANDTSQGSGDGRTVSPRESDGGAESRNLDEERSGEESVFIPGTTITLQTEGDIKKWIEERRRNWPSRKNVEAKKEKESASAPANDEQKKTGVSDGYGDQGAGRRKRRRSGDSEGRNVCKFFKNSGKCRFGSNCKNLHQSGRGANKNDEASFKEYDELKVFVPERFKNHMYPGENKTSLFKMMVLRDHYEHENDKILDFIEYLQEKNIINFS